MVKTKRKTRAELANARLIAAAPEMLQALELAAGQFDQMRKLLHDDDDEFETAMDAVNAAIAKAYRP